ncbi:MAG: hypothetical protein KAT34_16545 [Candidatus Aminicenantes bacterium]|nr:hypothetical protein [Candidatus Aminicenantes bacterium]
MKRSILFIFLLFMLTGFISSQFEIMEKVELKIIYEDGVINRATEIIFLSMEDDKSYFYSLEINPNNSVHTLYDIEPGRYLMGVKSGGNYLMGLFIYGIEVDTFTGDIGVSYNGPENEVDVYRNRNLKIDLIIRHSPTILSFVKESTKAFLDYDYSLFHLSIPDDEDYLNKNQINLINNISYKSINSGNELGSTSYIGNCTGQVNNPPYNNYISPYNKYSQYFNGCSYCRNKGFKIETLIEDDLGYNCEKVEFNKIDLEFVLHKLEETPIGSDLSIKLRMGTGGRWKRIGACGYMVIVPDKLKNGTVKLNLKTKSCEGEDCKCKYACELTIIIVKEIAYYNQEGFKHFLDCVVIPYRDRNNPNIMKKRTYDMDRDNNALIAFQNAIKEHEMLHCAQFYNLTLALFTGEEFLDKKNEITLLQKVCDKLPEYDCGCKGECKIEKCNSKINILKKKIRSLFSKYIKSAFKKSETSREKEAWDYTYIKFNEKYY